MKIRSVVAAEHIGFMLLLVAGIAAQAAEVKVLSAIGMQTVMEDLGPKFERAIGQLVITFATLGAANVSTVANLLMSPSFRAQGSMAS